MGHPSCEMSHKSSIRQQKVGKQNGCLQLGASVLTYAQLFASGSWSKIQISLYMMLLVLWRYGIS